MRIWCMLGILVLVLSACATKSTIVQPVDKTTAMLDVNETYSELEETPVETIVLDKSVPDNPKSSEKTWWKPNRTISLHIQFTDLPLDKRANADIYDLDLFDTNESVIVDLHERGKKVLCYFSAGTYEDWRPDYSSFEAVRNALGNELPDWPGEQWLDPRRIDLIGPIMTARLDLCKKKGFDGVDPDNVDAFQQNTGFRLRDADQTQYNIFLANEAHKRELAIGLKNDFDQARDLEPFFDFAISEECFEHDECDKFVSFVAAEKPVFDIEYRADPRLFCERLQTLQMQGMKKRKELDGWSAKCAEK